MKAHKSLTALIDSAVPAKTFLEANLGKRKEIWRGIDFALQLYVSAQARPVDLAKVRRAFNDIERKAREIYLLVNNMGSFAGTSSLELWNFMAKLSSGVAFTENPGRDDDGNGSARLMKARFEMEDRFTAIASPAALTEAMMALGLRAKQAAQLMPRTLSPDWPSKNLGRSLAAIWADLTGRVPSVRNDKDETRSPQSEFERFVELVLALLPREYPGPQNQHSFAADACRAFRRARSGRKKSEPE